MPDITAAGASLVAVSPELPEHTADTSRKNGVAFEILSDHDNALARRFGLVFQFPADLIDLYKTGFKNDLTVRNGTDRFELPIPATFVMGQDGVIRLAFVDSDYTKRLEPQEIVETLQALKSGDEIPR